MARCFCHRRVDFQSDALRQIVNLGVMRRHLTIRYSPILVHDGVPRHCIHAHVKLLDFFIQDAVDKTVVRNMLACRLYLRPPERRVLELVDAQGFAHRLPGFRIILHRFPRRLSQLSASFIFNLNPSLSQPLLVPRFRPRREQRLRARSQSVRARVLRRGVPLTKPHPAPRKLSLQRPDWTDIRVFHRYPLLFDERRSLLRSSFR